MILALALYGYPPIRIAHLPIQIMTPTHKLSAIHYPLSTINPFPPYAPFSSPS
jgi:hypothetical protein